MVLVWDVFKGWYSKSYLHFTLQYTVVQIKSIYCCTNVQIKCSKCRKWYNNTFLLQKRGQLFIFCFLQRGRYLNLFDAVGRISPASHWNLPQICQWKKVILPFLISNFNKLCKGSTTPHSSLNWEEKQGCRRPYCQSDKDPQLQLDQQWQQEAEEGVAVWGLNW